MTDRIAVKFAEFHNAHPWVYDRLKELAISLKDSGVKHYGISGLYETLRYEASLKAKDAEGFKLNNNYRALYARELARDEPAPENDYYGAFRCHHGHCINRGWADLTEWVNEQSIEELERAAQ